MISRKYKRNPDMLNQEWMPKSPERVVAYRTDATAWRFCAGSERLCGGLHEAWLMSALQPSLQQWLVA